MIANYPANQHSFCLVVTLLNSRDRHHRSGGLEFVESISETATRRRDGNRRIGEVRSSTTWFFEGRLGHKVHLHREVRRRKLATSTGGSRNVDLRPASWLRPAREDASRFASAIDRVVVLRPAAIRSKKPAANEDAPRAAAGRRRRDLRREGPAPVEERMQAL